MGWDVALVGELALPRSKHEAWKKTKIVPLEGPAGFPGSYPGPRTVARLLADLAALPAHRIKFSASKVAFCALLPKEDYQRLAAPLASACVAAASLGGSGELRLLGWITAPQALGFALAARKLDSIRTLTKAEHKATRALPAYAAIDALTSPAPEPPDNKPVAADAMTKFIAKIPRPLRPPIQRLMDQLLAQTDPALDRVIRQRGAFYGSIKGSLKDSLQSAKALRRVAKAPVYDDPLRFFEHALILLSLVAPAQAQEVARALFEAPVEHLPADLCRPAVPLVLDTETARLVPPKLSVFPASSVPTELVKLLAAAKQIETADLIAAFEANRESKVADIREGACVCAGAALVRRGNPAFVTTVATLVRKDPYVLSSLVYIARDLGIPLDPP